MSGLFAGLLRGGEYDFPYRQVSGAVTTLVPAMLSHWVFRDGVWLQTAPNAALCVGLLLAVMSVLCRAWAYGYLSAAVIGDRSMHSAVLVTTGPYSVTRNPLYLGTYCGALAIGCTTNPFWLCVVCAGATVRLIRLIDAEEQQFRRTQQPSDRMAYDVYCRNVPRLLPNSPTRVWQALREKTHWRQGVVANGFKSATPLWFAVALLLPQYNRVIAALPLVVWPLWMAYRALTADARAAKAKADIKAAAATAEAH